MIVRGDMMKKLTIYIPTYRRPKQLNRLLMSIIYGNKKCLNNISIVISSNDGSDVQSKNIAKKWNAISYNIKYYYNESNIGIDANHYNMYRYCSDCEHVLCVSDDDYLKENVLEKIISYCNNKFVFGIINSNSINKHEYWYKFIPNRFRRLLGIDAPVYHFDKFSLIDREAAIDIFTSSIYTPTILPMLPYYTGVLINMSYMNHLNLERNKNIFYGTMHQYLGILWNTFFDKYDNKIILINEPLFNIKIDGEKTWTKDMDDLIKTKIPKFYLMLNIDDELKRKIIEQYKMKIKSWGFMIDWRDML